MAFQFMCPRGHLLEGDHAQMGQTVQCPECGAAFVVPTVQQPAGDAAQLAPQELATAAAEAFPGVGRRGGDFLAQFGGPTGAGDRTVHVPCPQGHVLETAYDTMGQTVMCPHCGEMFELRYQDSYEHKHERRETEAKRIRKSGQLWLNWAIVIGIAVVIGIIAMIASMKN